MYSGFVKAKGTAGQSGAHLKSRPLQKLRWEDRSPEPVSQRKALEIEIRAAALTTLRLGFISSKTTANLEQQKQTPEVLCRDFRGHELFSVLC